MLNRGKSGGTCLILAAIAVFVAIVVRTDHSQADMAEQFADVEASRGLELVAAALFVLGAALFVPAGIGIAQIAIGRRSRLLYAGAILIAVGGMWFATGRAVTAHLLYSATAPGIPRDDALAGLLHITASSSFTIFVPLLLAFMVAPIVLGLGLWKAGIAPVWTAPAWLASLASFLAVEGSDIGELIGFGLMTVVLCWLGVAMTQNAAHDPVNTPVPAIEGTAAVASA